MAYKLSAEEALENLIRLIRMLGYEEEVMPLVSAYVFWLTGVDNDAKNFPDGIVPAWYAEARQHNIEQAQKYLRENE